MPYQRRGKKVYVKRGSSWRLKGRSKTISKAKAYKRVLESKKK